MVLPLMAHCLVHLTCLPLSHPSPSSSSSLSPPSLPSSLFLVYLTLNRFPRVRLFSRPPKREKMPTKSEKKREKVHFAQQAQASQKKHGAGEVFKVTAAQIRSACICISIYIYIYCRLVYTGTVSTYLPTSCVYVCVCPVCLVMSHVCHLVCMSGFVSKPVYIRSYLFSILPSSPHPILPILTLTIRTGSRRVRPSAARPRRALRRSCCRPIR